MHCCDTIRMKAFSATNTTSFPKLFWGVKYDLDMFLTGFNHASILMKSKTSFVLI